MLMNGKRHRRKTICVQWKWILSAIASIAGISSLALSCLPLHASEQIGLNPVQGVLSNKYQGSLVLPSDSKFDSNCKTASSGIISCTVAYRKNMLRKGDIVPIAAVREEDKKTGVYLYTIVALNCKSQKVVYRYVDGRTLSSAARRFRTIDFNSDLTKKLGSSWVLAPSWSLPAKEVNEMCVTR